MRRTAVVADFQALGKYVCLIQALNSTWRGSKMDVAAILISSLAIESGPTAFLVGRLLMTSLISVAVRGGG